MQNALRVESGPGLVENGEAADTTAGSLSLNDTIKKLNIIDMTGTSVQIQSSSALHTQKPAS